MIEFKRKSKFLAIISLHNKTFAVMIVFLYLEKTDTNQFRFIINIEIKILLTINFL